MSETKNVVIQQNNGTDYNILYPDSNSWKKDQVAVLETFQKYGLDANAIPKDLFDYLIGQMKTEYGKTYWWKKWKWNLNIKCFNAFYYLNKRRVLCQKPKNYNTIE